MDILKKELSEKLKALGSWIYSEPVILIKGNGETIVSDKAKKVIEDRRLNKVDLLRWINIGAQNLSNTTFCNLEVVMMRFPDKSNDILILLGKECPQEQIKHNLTLKEREILSSLIMGKTNKEIAKDYNISHETVNKHLDSIYEKLGVSNRVAAAFLALKKGLIVLK